MKNNQFNNAPLDKWMIVRAIVLFVALINQTLVMFGYHALPLDDAQVEHAVTIIFTIIATIWAWCKDNDVTYKARRRTKYNKDKELK